MKIKTGLGPSWVTRALLMVPHAAQFRANSTISFGGKAHLTLPTFAELDQKTKTIFFGISKYLPAVFFVSVIFHFCADCC